MLILALIHVLLHLAALRIHPAPSIAELTLNLLQRAVLVEVALEEAALYGRLPALGGALHGIFLALRPVLARDVFISSSFIAVLAVEWSFHALFRLVFVK